MSSKFTFPPPPPPPSKAVEPSQEQQTHGARGGSRGRAGGGHSSQRDFRGRGRYGNNHQRGGHMNPNASRNQLQYPPYGFYQPHPGWGAMPPAYLMDSYNMPFPTSMPQYAQALPNFVPGMPFSAWQQHQGDYRPPSENGSYGTGPEPERGGRKRKRKEVQATSPEYQVAPQVPSFNDQIPALRAVSASATQGAQTKSTPQTSTNSKKQKRQRTTNLLGLTPGGDEAVDSGSDVDEEAQLAAAYSGPLKVIHNGKTVVLDSPEKLNAWVDERKKNFPTRERLRKKKAEKARLDAQIAQAHAEVDAQRKSHQQSGRKETPTQSHAKPDEPQKPQEPQELSNKLGKRARARLRRQMAATSKQDVKGTSGSDETGKGEVVQQEVASTDQGADQAAQIKALEEQAKALGFSIMKTKPVEPSSNRLESQHMHSGMDPTKQRVDNRARTQNSEEAAQVSQQNPIVQNSAQLADPQPQPVVEQEGITSVGVRWAIDITSDPFLSNAEPPNSDTHGPTQIVQPTFSPDDGSSSSSSTSSTSDTDSDSDSDSEDSASRTSTTSRKTAGNTDNQANTTASIARTATDHPICRAFQFTGRCKYGLSCRFSHELLDNTDKVKKSGQPEKPHLSLHQRLIDQEQEEQNRLVLNAIKFLGERGLLAPAPNPEIEAKINSILKKDSSNSVMANTVSREVHPPGAQG